MDLNLINRWVGLLGVVGESKSETFTNFKLGFGMPVSVLA